MVLFYEYENVTESQIARFSPRLSWIQFYITALFLGAIILWTIIGNVFVVAAIVLERTLKNVSNYLILSLAVADLMVAILVMPISAIKEVSSTWWLGIELCDLWTCFDVLSCTASILHLVVIAIDRYWAVTDINYLHRRTSSRIILMIIGVWLISVIISVPSRFHTHRNNAEWLRVIVNGSCIINESVSYTVFSNLGAFYLPMAFMSVIYLRIYIFARSRIRYKRKKMKQNHCLSNTDHKSCTDQTKPTENTGQCPCNKRKIDEISYILNCEHCKLESLVIQNQNRKEWFDKHMSLLEFADEGENDSLSIQSNFYATTFANVKFENVDHVANVNCVGENDRNKAETMSNHSQKKINQTTNWSPKLIFYNYKAKLLNFKNDLSFKGSNKSSELQFNDDRSQSSLSFKDNKFNAMNSASIRNKVEQKRERKAARTLAIITGCFIICWLPFGINNVAHAFCNTEPCGSALFDSLCLWLGYVNSGLNPVIYTVFSPDFRTAFRKILLGHYHTRRCLKC
uniref:GCR006 n=1 Tax=Schmidtea mediterranea TaxID=79327 RepID=A0A193KU56_SCHMD|nr:GCR006 [Schmidtea mediterranea]